MNEKLFWTLIFLRVRILLIFVAIFILFCMLPFSFSSKPAALPEVFSCFYLLGFGFVSVLCFLISWKEIALMVTEIKDCNVDIKTKINLYTLT